MRKEVEKLEILEFKYLLRLLDLRKEIKLVGLVCLDKDWNNFDEYNFLNNWWNNKEDKLDLLKDLFDVKI